MGLREYQCDECELIFNCQCERPIVKLQQAIHAITGGGWARPWRFLPEICLGCRGIDDDPSLSTGKLMYGSSFFAKHWYKISRLGQEMSLRWEVENFLDIYREKWGKGAVDWNRKVAPILIAKRKEFGKQAENTYRDKYRVPRIGEGWVSETQLFNTVRALLAGYEVIHNGSPEWLKPQHFDVWVPGLSLALEYQGGQHFEAIEFFGGPEAFEKRKALDRRKASLAKSHGVKLIYVKDEDDISGPALKTILKRAFRLDFTSTGSDFR